MSVHVIGKAWMVSDRTAHQARRVSDDAWVVSYLRGRMLTTEQATAAMQAAEAVSVMDELAQRMGLTALEAIGLAVLETPWDTKPPRHLRLLPRPAPGAIGRIGDRGGIRGRVDPGKYFR